MHQLRQPIEHRIKPAPVPSRYVSIGFAAHRASVSKDTIRRMIADGTLPAYRFRGQIRIAIEDIDKAMRPLR
ncbi:excisionase family DNA-binding protein [Nocardia sp. R7R-8]|uniref:excisionase family DNA-binding protein n=1 Tax=Nocardia sp. R7R-8 TaxID=3459304 RepID=UPI00403DC9DE